MNIMKQMGDDEMLLLFVVIFKFLAFQGGTTVALKGKFSDTIS